MSTIKVIFTHRRWNPISWFIRWAMPRSRFAFALSSHAIVVGPDQCYEATMLHGVRAVDYATAINGQVIVRERRYQVPDAAAGLKWAAEQARRKVPYDWGGALGLSLAPGRDWAEADAFFCYEFAAAVLRAAGRDLFADLSHVGETALLAINP